MQKLITTGKVYDRRPISIKIYLKKWNFQKFWQLTDENR